MRPLVSKYPYVGAANLLPGVNKHEIALHYVIGVMCALACLAFLVAITSDRAAGGWSRDIRSEITVQIRPQGLESSAVVAANAAEIISGVRGVSEAAALEPEKAKALLKPWLGDVILDDLPIPNLVEVRLDPKAPASVTSIEAALKQASIDAYVDDHSVWLRDIEQSALKVRLLALGAFILLGTAAGAVVAFATRAGLAAQADMVETLSLCGATDTFIAERLQFRFTRMAFEAGLLGTLSAALVAAGLKVSGGDIDFALALPLTWPDLLLMIPCPFLVAFIAALTARLITLRILQSA
jgi:cell division transport system permease protein